MQLVPVVAACAGPAGAGSHGGGGEGDGGEGEGGGGEGEGNETPASSAASRAQIPVRTAGAVQPATPARHPTYELQSLAGVGEYEPGRLFWYHTQLDSGSVTRNGLAVCKPLSML